jgi:hypothetical protein
MTSIRSVSPWVLALAGFALLGVNLLWVPAAVSSAAGEGWALGIYAAARFAIILLLGLGWIAYAGLKRSQALWGVGFMILAEQFILRGGSLLYDAYRHPEGWAGASVSAISFGLLMGYLVFLPLVMIVAWLGTELGTKLVRR